MPEDILEPANEATEETFGAIDNAQEAAPAKAPSPPPASAPAAISILSLIPREILGLPLIFWGGTIIWLILLFVLFLYG